MACPQAHCHKSSRRKKTCEKLVCQNVQLMPCVHVSECYRKLFTVHSPELGTRDNCCAHVTMFLDQKMVTCCPCRYMLCGNTSTGGSIYNHIYIEFRIQYVVAHWHWRCGDSLVAFQTTEAVVPGSNPAHLTVKKL